jgi:uncharacterized Zn-binding protein involved in type VI secretion
MAGAVRIGDKVSCGDKVAQGSSDVFANNIGIAHEGAKKTTGHPKKFAPTVFKGPFSSTVFVNNNPVVLNGKTEIVPHSNKDHKGAKASSGSKNVEIE